MDTTLSLISVSTPFLSYSLEPSIKDPSRINIDKFIDFLKTFNILFHTIQLKHD
jgi:hypothetical protein